MLTAVDAAAQEISGSVIDENNEPMEYATLALIDMAGSTLVAGRMTDAEGRFCLDAGVHGADGLIVRVTSVGYEAKYAALPLSGLIHMKPLPELAGVTITGVRKMPLTNRSGA